MRSIQSTYIQTIIFGLIEWGNATVALNNESCRNYWSDENNFSCDPSCYGSNVPDVIAEHPDMNAIICHASHPNLHPLSFIGRHKFKPVG